MIIYDTTGLYNILVVDETSEACRKGLITEEELVKIKQAHPSPFYTPNIFVRAGFFLLTCIISSFSAGLLSLIFLDSNMISGYAWLLFLGLANYAALELSTKRNRYYRAGVDDALIWISGSLIAGTFMLIAEGNNTLISGFIFLLSLMFTLRFTDRLTAVVAYLAALACIFFSWQKMGDFGLLSIPFVLMAVSAATYVFSKRVEGLPAGRYYKSCLKAVQLVSLLTLYLSANYYVVKELGDMLSGEVSDTIPFAWFFWLWTIAIPFVYIAWGVRNKDLLLIRTGLLLITLAVFTFRNYYHMLPVELAFTIGGIVVLAVTWFLIKYLHTPKAGFTSVQADRSKEDDELNVESLIVSETFSDVGTHDDGGTTFGGGRFGGGGSSSDF